MIFHLVLRHCLNWLIQIKTYLNLALGFEENQKLQQQKSGTGMLIKLCKALTRLKLENLRLNSKYGLKLKQDPKRPES